jgi:hypothetical protein
LLVDGRAIGDPIAFTPDTKGALVLPEFAKLLTPGKHTLAMKMDKGSEMPFSLALNYYNAQPSSSDQCKVGLTVTFPNATLLEGAVSEVNVTVTNRSAGWEERMRICIARRRSSWR